MFKSILKLMLHMSPFFTISYTRNIVWFTINLLVVATPYIKVKKIQEKLRGLSVSDRIGLKKNLRFWRSFTF